MRVSKLAGNASALLSLILCGSVVCASSVGPLAQSAIATDPVQADGRGRDILPPPSNPLAISVQYVTLETSPASTTATSAHGNQPPHAEEQQRILNAALVPAVKRLGVPLDLVVNYLNACDDWAFLHARMRGSHGQDLSYTGTPEQQAAAHGLKSDSYAALLRRDRRNWDVIADAIGSTDVPWVNWSTRYRAPRAIFPTQPQLAWPALRSPVDVTQQFDDSCDVVRQHR